MEKEVIKLNVKTLQAIINYLQDKPYKDVAELISTIIYEANNQQIFDGPQPALPSENISE